jgi:hypothetical protein
MIPYFLDNRLIDGSFVSLTSRPRFTNRKIFWYSFLLEAEAVVRLKELGKLKKKISDIGTRTCDLPACSIVSQSAMLPCSRLVIYIAPNDVMVNELEMNG